MQVPGAPEPRRAADEQLAAPHGPVRPVARAVEDRADGVAGLAVLGQAGGQVGVVVLHADELQALLLARPRGREVVRVQVVGHDLRRHGQQAPEVLDRLAERAERLQVLQVADVVAGPGAVAARQADRVLELRAAAKRRSRDAGGQRHRGGDVPAGAAQKQRAASGHPDHGVVRARLDRPVVDEEEVGDAGQSREGVLVAEGDGLVGDVAARHHERQPRVGQQQVVQRRVGQHQPQLGHARRDGRRHRLAAPAKRQHDRPLG
jgi:hypothetical protein